MNIPLGGLLGTEGLDAIVTCELEADKNTLATVLGRQQLLPLSSRNNSQAALGPKLGKITCRLTVISDSNTDTVSTTQGQGQGWGLRDSQLDNAFGTAYPVKRGSRGEGERRETVYERGEVKESPVWGKQGASSAPSLLLPVPPTPPTASAPASVPAPVSVRAVGHTVTFAVPSVPPHPTRIGAGGDIGRGTGVDMGRDIEGDPSQIGADRMQIQGQVGPVPEEDPLHSAMSYVPSEVPQKHPTQKAQAGVGQRAVMSVVLKSLFGLDVGALQPKGVGCEGGAEGVMVCRAVVAYKLSTR